MDAEMTGANGKLAAEIAESNCRRISWIERLAKRRIADGRQGIASYLATDYYLADAQVLLITYGRRQDAADLSYWKQKRVAAARLLLSDWWQKLDTVMQAGYFMDACRWSGYLLESELSIAKNKQKELEALTEYCGRMRALESFANGGGKEPVVVVAEPYIAVAHYLRLAGEAKLALSADDKRISGKALDALLVDRLRAAEHAYALTRNVFLTGQSSLEEMYEMSLAIRSSALLLASDAREQIAVEAAHSSRIAEMFSLVMKWYNEGRTPRRNQIAVSYYRAEADRLANK